MSLPKFAIAGVLAAGLGLATATPADAQVYVGTPGGYIVPGGGYYVRPTPYVVPSYGYGYRYGAPYYGYDSFGYGYPGYGYGGYRYRSGWGGYPGYGWGGSRYGWGYPGYYGGRSGVSFGFTFGGWR